MLIPASKLSLTFSRRLSGPSTFTSGTLRRTQPPPCAARTALARVEFRVESLARREEEIERLRAALDVERNARVTAEQSAAVLGTKLEKTEAQVNDLQGRLARAEDDARGATAEASEWRGQMVALRTGMK